MGRIQAITSVVALLALVAVVGTVTYVSVRDEPAAPTTTTTTTTVPTAEAVAGAITEALTADLDVPLSPDQASCVASGLVGHLGLPRLDDLAREGGGLADLTESERDGLVRAIVLCVPPDTAAALLSPATTTTAPSQLPDEGADQ